MCYDRQSSLKTRKNFFMLTAVIVCIIGAILSGLIAGLLGLGGGAVLVPLFFFLLPLFDVSEHIKNIAVGTSLMCIIFTSISSIYSHYKKQGIDFKIVPPWGALHFMGAIFGATVAIGLSENSVRIVYVIATTLLVLYRLSHPNRAWFSYKAIFRGGLPFPFLSGWLSSTIGIGGGNNVQALALFGVPIKNAVATSSVMGMAIAIPATSVYIIHGWQHMDSLPAYSLGYVSLPLVAVTVPISMTVANYAARMTYMFKPLYLNTMSCLLGLFLSLQMGWALF